jgi:hypothetical protein
MEICYVEISASRCYGWNEHSETVRLDARNIFFLPKMWKLTILKWYCRVEGSGKINYNLCKRKSHELVGSAIAISARKSHKVEDSAI